MKWAVSLLSRQVTTLSSLLLGLAAGVVFAPHIVCAQQSGRLNQFGAQERADAAERMIVLAVQQAISSLPPTSAQSFTYEFDPKLDAVVRSKHLGPTVLRSPKPIGEGHGSLRLSTSYLKVSDSLRPVDYSFQENFLTRFGLDVSADVTIINFAANYGLTKRIEINANLPVVITHTRASQVFISTPSAAPDTVVAVQRDPPGLIDSFLRGGGFILRRQPLTAVATGFGEGTNTGVGRIAVGAKALVYSAGALQLALAPEFFFPSPDQDEFAGSDSGAVLPRALAAISLGDRAKLYCDVGYDLDFDADELRRFVWNAGASIPIDRVTVDLGFGGSEFNRGIRWTPDSASYSDGRGQTSPLTVIGDNELGTTFVDFIGGVKVRLTKDIVLSGAVNVPVSDQGFRPAAVGTIAVELYL